MGTRQSIKVTGRTRDLVIFVDKAIYRFTYHWVAFFNLLLLAFVVPFFLAPCLAHAGHESASDFLYSAYRLTCHQRPERSFFLYGPKLTYTWDELVAGGMDTSGSEDARTRFIGSPEMGYKTAVCARDVTIYVGLIVMGALYALFFRRWLKPLPWWGFVLFVLPMAIDGLTQVMGFRESTATLRVVTGLCVAAGSIGFAYPHVESAMVQLRGDIAHKLHLPR